MSIGKKMEKLESELKAGEEGIKAVTAKRGPERHFDQRGFMPPGPEKGSQIPQGEGAGAELMVFRLQLYSKGSQPE